MPTSLLVRKLLRKLFLYNGTGRASSSAGTAAKACVCIDYILVISLGNSSDRALTGASAALNTTIIDYKCHNYQPPV